MNEESITYRHVHPSNLLILRRPIYFSDRLLRGLWKLWERDPRVPLRSTRGYHMPRLRRSLKVFRHGEFRQANMSNTVSRCISFTIGDRSSLVNFSTRRHKLFRLLFHPHAQRRLFVDLFLRRVLAHVLGDLHSGRSVGPRSRLRGERFTFRDRFGDIFLFCASGEPRANQEIERDCRIAGFHFGNPRLAGAKTLCQLTL
jgi:hypothetical protein